MLTTTAPHVYDMKPPVYNLNVSFKKKNVYVGLEYTEAGWHMLLNPLVYALLENTAFVYSAP